MPKAKKDGHFLNCYIKQELWDELSVYFEETGVAKTTILEKALSEFFEKYVPDNGALVKRK